MTEANALSAIATNLAMDFSVHWQEPNVQLILSKQKRDKSPTGKAQLHWIAQIQSEVACKYLDGTLLLKIERQFFLKEDFEKD